MVKKFCAFCLSVLLSAGSFVTTFAADEDDAPADSKKAQSPVTLKVKNPYARERADIDALEKKQRSMSVGKRRNEMDAKIVAKQKKLDEKMKKNVASMNHTLDGLMRQYERASDESKKKDIGIKINKIRAEIELHKAWCSGGEEDLQKAVAKAEKAFSPNASGDINEEEEEEEPVKKGKGKQKKPAKAKRADDADEPDPEGEEEEEKAPAKKTAKKAANAKKSEDAESEDDAEEEKAPAKKTAK